MIKTFKYRIYPNKEQSVLLNKHVGACRFIYNLALECKQVAWSGNKANLSCFQLMKQLKDLKEECKWLKEINAQSLQQAIVDLDKAYSSFFKLKSNFPKFKKKSDYGSFRVPQSISLKGDRMVIPKFRDGIKIKIHREIKGEIKSVTIKKTPTGKFFAYILCETEDDKKDKIQINEKTTIGIDLGVKSYIVASNGFKVDNPRFLTKSQSKLKYIQRRYSKHKGARTRKKIAILHEKVSNKRKDFLNKISSELIKSHDSFAIEDLNIKEMLKNGNFSQGIFDSAWGKFVNMLEYKAEWNGKNVIKIGRFDPSSKLHAKCGYINKSLKLSERFWHCPKCGEEVDRDLNAAINIKEFALKKILSGTDRKNQAELPTMVGVLTLEVNSI